MADCSKVHQNPVQRQEGDEMVIVCTKCNEELDRYPASEDD